MNQKKQPFCFYVILLLVISLAQTDWSFGQRSSEEQVDYYLRWLNQDVIYIITDEEKAVFEQLTTPEEKDAFIEQFWLRRDPSPGGLGNGFRDEHYRRLAYANERFSSGVEGWTTDRGRIYIVFGPPKTVDRYPTGQVDARTGFRGGGETFNYPYEVWYYDHLEGIGSGISLEFVDPTFSGHYRLALHAYEKDALLDKPGTGMTRDEAHGLVSKRIRVDTLAMLRPSHPEGHVLADRGYQAFDQLQRYFAIRRPPEIKYEDLQQMVTSRISYNADLDLQLVFDYGYFYLDPDHSLVPVRLRFLPEELSSRGDSGSTQPSISVAIYGRVSDLSRRVHYEFEDTLRNFVDSSRDDVVYLYEKKLPLKPGRYKLEMVARDENSGRYGIVERSLYIPPMVKERLALSSINLLSGIRMAGPELPLTDPFVVPGGFKAYPMLNHGPQAKVLGIHCELYQSAIAQDTGMPNVGVNIEILNERGERVYFERLPRSALKLFGHRIVLIHDFDISRLAPGKYRLELSAYDAIHDYEVKKKAGFSL